MEKPVCMRKIMILSPSIPPFSASGQASELHQILKHLAPSEYFFVTQEFADHTKKYSDPKKALGCKTYFISTKFILGPGNRLGFKRLGIILEVIGIPWFAFKLYKLIRSEVCRTVVACSGNLVYLPGALVACKLARIPFFAFIMDYYRHQYLDKLTLWFAKFFEPIVLRNADGVIVLSEAQQKEYQRLYRVDSEICPPPVDRAVFQNRLCSRRKKKDRAVRNIVYTGSISEAHYDALRNLIDAIRMLRDRTVGLKLYTAQSRQELADRGIDAEFVSIDFAGIDEIPTIQSEADILFFPLAFKSPFPDIIRTAAPGKLGEYLASGTPILVHAPEYAFISKFFRESNGGYVVDEDDPKRLAEAIELLLDDESLSQELSMNALKLAIDQFDSRRVSQRFVAYLKDNGGSFL